MTRYSWPSSLANRPNSADNRLPRGRIGTVFIYGSLRKTKTGRLSDPRGKDPVIAFADNNVFDLARVGPLLGDQVGCRDKGGCDLFTDCTQRALFPGEFRV